MKKLMHWVMPLILGLVAAVTAAVTPVHAADNSLQKIQAKGTIVMGTSPDYAPYEFLVNENGKNQVVGIDVEIAKKIAADMGVKLVIKQMDFDSLLVGLQTGKVDMVLSAMTPTAERKQSVDFSSIYYTADQDIIVNKADAKLYKSAESFVGKKVGAQTGSMQADLVKSEMTDSKLLGLTKVTDLILALKSHKVEGVVAEEPVATAYVQNDPQLAMVKSGWTLDPEENGQAIGFAKGSDALVAQANQSIAEIKKQGLIKSYMKTAGKAMTQNTANTSMFHYWQFFAKGIGYTLLITAVAVVIGVLLGTLLALMRLGHVKLVKALAVAYIEFVRGTPLMIQVMFVYFGIGMFIDIPALIAGIIAVALNSGAYVAEIIRGGIESIPTGQTEAARSLGLSQKQTMQSVVLPQAIKNIWPALGNEFISLIKESSIVSIIGVTDLIYQLKVVQTATYKGVQPIFVAMVIYFVLTFGLSKLLGHFERKMKHE
ncbi:ABC transporter substrate-binding protein/permease [Lacticaseibacillus absianus]|uniref:ABC transporter substrate-binding protein/permease n=1 Tax=Lacticaseibacillus absianus TaxID=2729623 RepID=UPI0015C6FB89|nr:ABC transporter substrate-binding protein/permease [Lacticaseibacillus absianus]